MALYDRNDLVESTIHPGLESAQEDTLELFTEMEGQLDKEVSRLKVLRGIYRDDPGAYISPCRPRHGPRWKENC